MSLAGALLLAGGVVLTLPQGIEAVQLLAAADSPERLVELGLDRHLDAARAGREIEEALAGGDAELAVSMLALADERTLEIEPRLRARVEAAAGIAATALRTTGRFVDGFVVGAPDDIASLAGTMTGDLLIYGDVRDVVRETSHLVRGQEADELVLGLACVGLAVTAGTYATLGAGAPARAGVSVVKAASKTGRLSARLAGAMMRPLREAVDTAALKGAVTPVLLMQPGLAIRSLRAAVKLEKADGVVRVVGDVGRVQRAAGTRAALDTLRLADSPQEVAKLARLAQAKGGKTRAVLKVLGRGAIALSVGMFQLASWTVWALMMLFGFAASFKRFSERVTQRYLDGRRRARLRRLATAAAGR